MLCHMMNNANTTHNASGRTIQRRFIMARTARITHTCTRTGFTITGTPDEIAEHFYRDKSQKSGFSPWTKDAERAYNKAYRAGLTKANAPRKADADEKGIKAFDATMKAMGARTSRKSKGAKATKVTRTRATRDGSRTRAAKSNTKARKAARATKKAKS